MEDTEALLFTKATLIDLIDRISTLPEWIIILDANFAIASQRRLNAAITLSAEGRYHDLGELSRIFTTLPPTYHCLLSWNQSGNP